jgi:hypothetical protein
VAFAAEMCSLETWMFGKGANPFRRGRNASKREEYFNERREDLRVRSRYHGRDGVTYAWVNARKFGLWGP